MSRSLPRPVAVSLAFTVAFVATAIIPVAPAEASEFCDVLNRFNAEKKISDPEIRSRVEGQYGRSDDPDRLRTWNIATVCEDFLVAVPLWADVSPPVMTHKGGDLFEDYSGAVWEFVAGAEGAIVGVKMTAADGTTIEMKRIGDPRSFD